MIRRIRFDSNNKNNTFYNNDRNDISFGGPLIKYGFPQRNWDEFRPRPMNREENEPPIVKYGYPAERFSEEQQKEIREKVQEYIVKKYGMNPQKTTQTDIPKEKSRYKYEISQPYIDPDESEEDIAREINEDLFSEEEFPKEEVPRQKTSYFKRLWFAVLGKDAQ